MKQAWWIKASAKSRAKRKAQLQMAPSVAERKLARKIIFSLLVELDRVQCFRCGRPFTETDFSIEHKKPWLDVSPELFWDMRNIAFSHRCCNSSARRSHSGRRHSTKREAARIRFSEWYSVPVNRDKWNARRRELYAKKKVVGP